VKRAGWMLALAFGLPFLLVLGIAVLFAKPEAQACTGGAAVGVTTGPLPAAVAGYKADPSLTGAAAIMQAAKDAGLDQRAQTIGVMTAMGESSLTPVDHGDAVGPDSLGWFQQRDPWGPREARLDAYRSATMFFTGGQGGQPGLADIPGWEAMTPTAAAHAVQRNADPYYYTKFWDAAVAVVAALADVPVTVTPGTGGQVCTDQPPGQLPVAPGAWVRPNAGALSSGYGPRWGTFHYGQDFAAPCGSPNYAAHDGTVVLVAYNNAPPATGYGTLVAIEHGGGVVTRYAHAYNQDVLVHVGDRVKAGQEITRVGSYGDSTGCHLHFEVQINGQFTDPAVFLREHGVPL
jgi:hypothetical protein